MKQGIAQTLELLYAVDALAKCIVEAKKDGVLNIWDAPKFAALILPAKKAVEGADQISLEMKDLDPVEIQTVVNKMFESVSALASAVISKPAAPA
jgi:hypothetical protein